MPVIVGTNNPETLNGTSGADNIFGLGGADTINGLGGDDVIDGGTGDDIIFGNDGNDSVVLDLSTGGADTIDLGTGLDLVFTGGSTGQIRLTFASAQVGNGDPNDSVLGGLNVRLQAENGADGLTGPQSRIDDEGTIFVAAAGQTFDVRDTGGAQRGDQFEVVTLGTAAADFLTAIQPSRPYYFNGGMGDDTIIGGLANDFLVGGAGNDVLNGGAGTDTLLGGTGNDQYFVDSQADVVIEDGGNGNDIVYASVSYVLAALASVEVLGTVDNNATTAINLTGNERDNYITGNAGANTLDGGASGADQLWGRAGNDSYFVDADDLVVEYAGQGFDIVYARTDHVLQAGFEIEVLGTVDNTATTPINLTGNDLANYITGNAGANRLDGGPGGADTLWGREGNDSYFVDSDDIVVEYAGQGFDTVYARSSHVLHPGYEVEVLGTIDNNATTAINLKGNEFANYVTGNAGNNVIDGGAGNDYLQGRGGVDTFAFSTGLSSNNVDVIDDFVLGTDKIALDDAIFAGIGTPGSFNANAFFAGTAAHDSDDRIIYDQATGQLYYDADGNGALAATLFAIVAGRPALTGADFTVI